jgi:hypothetical protein
MEDIRLSGATALPVPATTMPQSADVVSRAGHALRTAADRLRSSTVLERDQLQRLRSVTGALDSVGEYLERRRLQGVRLDAERLVIARPVVALLAAVLLGYAAGRAVRR